MPGPPPSSPPPFPLSGRLILITGGNGTIAAATAVAVARRGAAVVLGCRRPDAAAAAVREVREAVPAASVRSHPLDLSSPASVAAFARAFAPPAARPAALLNAAATGNLFGVSVRGLWCALTRRPLAGNGTEGGGVAAGCPPPELVVNAVGVAALTAAICGAGAASPPPLVVNLSSRAHRQAHLPSLLRALEGAPPPNGVAGAVRAAFGYPPYADAKLANLLAVRAAAAAIVRGGSRGSGGGGGMVVAVHPGVVASGLFPTPLRAVLRALPPRVRAAVGGRDASVVGEELADLLQRGLTGGLGGSGGGDSLVHGGYYVPGGRLGVVGSMVTPAAVRAYERAMARALVACGFVERGGGASA
ncbi:hypothetical protein MMPV_005342 [Pyropia vietnamensis]